MTEWEAVGMTGLGEVLRTFSIGFVHHELYADLNQEQMTRKL